MAYEIALEDLTSGSVLNPGTQDASWTGSGVFDKLMIAVNANIDLQYKKNRITGTEYATVYLGGIQTVVDKSLQFLLSDKMTEMQIALAEKDLELKEKEIEIRDQELAIQALNQSKLQYEVNVLLPDQHTTNIKQQTLLDTEEAAKQYEVDVLLVDNHNSNIKDIEIKERNAVIEESKLEDQLLTSIKQRTLLDTEEEAKQYEVTHILPANLTSIEKDIDIKERSVLLQEAEVAKKIEVMDDDMEFKERQMVITETESAQDVVLKVLQQVQVDKQTLNLENQDLLTLVQIGKTKAETDIAMAVAEKDIDLKEVQWSQVSAEIDIIKQKYIGRKH